MGHSEGASGIAALIKALLVATEGVIPPNLHFNSTTHAPILSERTKLVTKLQKYDTTQLVAVNNFGFGGTNALVIGKSGALGRKEGEVEDVEGGKLEKKMTRYLFGRTQAAIEAYLVSGELSAAYWSKLLRSSNALAKFPFRAILTHTDDEDKQERMPSSSSSSPCYELEVVEITSSCAPLIAFSYTGQGSQWMGMASDLFRENALFRTVVLEACDGLPIDITCLFETGDKWCDKAYSGLGITLVQLGLTAMLREAGIAPDFIFGHSVGEVACGYADGCTSAKQAAALAYVRCQLSDKIVAHGLMIAAGLSLEEAKTLLEGSYPETVIACHNSPDGVTLSGPAEDILSIKAELEASSKFVRLVPTDGIAYHSTFFRKHRDQIEVVLQEAFASEPAVKQRTSRWLSTSHQENALLADAAYHTNNVAGMVNFCPIVASLPANTIVIEIGPHALLKSVIQRCNPSLTSVLSAMTAKEKGVLSMHKLVDNLWLLGASFNFPIVRRVLPLAERVHMKWDHSVDWRIANYKDFESSGVTTVSYDLMGRDSYLRDHVINGKAIFPAAGYIYTVWQVVGGASLHLADIRILQAVLLAEETVNFTVSVTDKEFRVLHHNHLVCRGRIVKPSPISNKCPPSILASLSSLSHEVPQASAADVYRAFARRGYDYKSSFRLIQARSADHRLVTLAPTQYWVAYLDNLLQASIVQPTSLRLPTEIQSIDVYTNDISLAHPTVLYSAENQLVGNHTAVIRGLRTTLTRKSYKQPVTKGIEFQHYGERIYVYEEGYKTKLLKELSVFFWRIYDDMRQEEGFEEEENCLGSYPFLSKIAMLSSPRSSRESSSPSSTIDLTSAATSDSSDDSETSSCCWPLLDLVSHLSNLSSKEILSQIYLLISTSPSHDEVYFSDPSCSISGEDLTSGLELMMQIVRDNCHGKAYSVLEVGAGSGGLTRRLYPIIAADIASYTASDVSVIKPSFPEVQCLKYNVSETWKEGKVDLIAASNSLHTTPNLTTALTNVHRALQDSGFLLLHEYICLLPVLLWGLSDFAFDTEDERDFGLWITKDRWFELLSRTGFEPIIWYIDASSTQLLLLAKKIPSETSSLPLSISTRNAIVANNAQVFHSSEFGDLAFVRSLRKEPGYSGLSLSLSIAGGNRSAALKTALPLAVRKEGRLGGIHEIALSVRKDSCQGYHAVVTTPGDLGSLKWIENASPPNCKVFYCGVNFKDVMLAYGKLVGEGVVQLGLEFSGKLLTENGRLRDKEEEEDDDEEGVRVMGISIGSMATHVYCPPHLMWSIPPQISFEVIAMYCILSSWI